MLVVRAGLDALQQASIASGVPLAILLLGACWALLRAFRREEAESPAAPGGTSTHTDGRAPQETAPHS